MRWPGEDWQVVRPGVGGWSQQWSFSGVLVVVLLAALGWVAPVS